MLQKYLVILFTLKMPLRNSRSGLNLRISSLQQMEGQDLQHQVWNVACLVILLPGLRQPRFLEVASWVGICHAESGNRTRHAEGILRAQNEAMWQNPCPAGRHHGTWEKVNHCEEGWGTPQNKGEKQNCRLSNNDYSHRAQAILWQILPHLAWCLQFFKSTSHHGSAFNIWLLLI